jgi:hypothetical protein
MRTTTSSDIWNGTAELYCISHNTQAASDRQRRVVVSLCTTRYVWASTTAHERGTETATHVSYHSNSTTNKRHRSAQTRQEKGLLNYLDTLLSNTGNQSARISRWTWYHNRYISRSNSLRLLQDPVQCCTVHVFLWIQKLYDHVKVNENAQSHFLIFGSRYSSK